MRSRILAVVATLTLLAASAANAQEMDGRVGIGVGIANFSIGDVESLLMPTIYVPVLAGDRFLVEPSLGLLRMSQGNTTETLLAVGTGLLLLVQPSADGRVYFGPRIGVIRFAESFESPTISRSDSESNLTLSGVFGGEYFLRPTFSLGGEAGLKWIDLSGGSLVSTTTEFRVRWYFP